MANNQFHPIATLATGQYDYKIKARIIRKWRASNPQGEEFKGFNVILLDNQSKAIHGFCPWSSVQELESKLMVGKVCSIKNFTVQLYKDTDIYRCLHKDRQLVFTKDTIVQDVEDNGKEIQQEHFDFHDHSELKDFSNQKLYLADIVGIIKNYSNLKDINNKLGKMQKQAKMTLTDGSSQVNITFWDKYAEKFDTAMSQNLEKPVILILASCRVGLWKDEVDISNVGATTFYLNFKHQSVLHLRKMLAQPQFFNKVFKEPEKKIIPLLKLADIHKLGEDFIQKEVLIHVNIRQVEDQQIWYMNICTTCDNETEVDNGLIICSHCPRIVPYPDKIYKLNVVVEDDSGKIQVIMQDREVRTIVGIRARELYDENAGKAKLPNKLQNLAKKDYTILILIQQINVVDGIHVYKATNICSGFQMPKKQDNPESIQHSQTNSQATTSSYRIQQLSSQGNCEFV